MAVRIPFLVFHRRIFKNLGRRRPIKQGERLGLKMGFNPTSTDRTRQTGLLCKQKETCNTLPTLRTGRLDYLRTNQIITYQTFHTKVHKFEAIIWTKLLLHLNYKSLFEWN